MRGFTLAILIVVVGFIAYELCMTVTMLGGYLPLAILTGAPLLGFALGRT